MVKRVVNEDGGRWKRVLALVLVGAGLSYAALCAAAEAEKGEKQAAFSDPERVAQFLDNSPSAAVGLFEAVMSQEQIDAVERAMFPEASKEEQEDAYAKVETVLKRLGLAGDDALLKAVSARKASLSAVSGVSEERGKP